MPSQCVAGIAGMARRTHSGCHAVLYRYRVRDSACARHVIAQVWLLSGALSAGGHGAAPTACCGAQADLVRTLGLCVWARRLRRWEAGALPLATPPGAPEHCQESLTESILAREGAMLRIAQVQGTLLETGVGRDLLTPLRLHGVLVGNEET